MEDKMLLVEDKKPFSKSIIWELNKNYYQKKGIAAWREGEVPHHMTSNAFVGKTYAELIFSLLQDVAKNEQCDKTVYILELGAGHARLCFHILKYLNKKIQGHQGVLPSFCYILSDISSDNIDFFIQHPQLQSYYDHKQLDVAYFDALTGDSIDLLIGKRKVDVASLDTPLTIVANYFFDSIPFDLFKFKKGKIKESLIKIETDKSFADANDIDLKDIELQYFYEEIVFPFYNDTVLDNILAEYQSQVNESFVLYPSEGLKCLNRLKLLSNKGVMLITMDKGIHHLALLDNKPKPDWVTHGSFSFTVNYHAFIRHCELNGGKAMFCKNANFHLELGCLLLVEDAYSYTHVLDAYRLYVDDFGPDDFYSLVKMTYGHVADLSFQEILSMLRLGLYDSTLFENLLKRIKQQIGHITYGERDRLHQSINFVWENYFNLDESDLAFEIAGIMYDLGFYKDAVGYFNKSIDSYGYSENSYFNLALCHFQLNEDEKCMALVKQSKMQYPLFMKMDEFAIMISDANTKN
jgi:hypothetical protein